MTRSEDLLLRISDNIIERIKGATTINEINVVAIQELIRLCFSLLGSMPNHMKKKAPYHDKYWHLSGHRSICYTQTAEQKVSLILNLIDIRKLYRIEPKDYEDLHEVFYCRFESNADNFLRWFKQNYPQVYCEIF